MGGCHRSRNVRVVLSADFPCAVPCGIDILALVVGGHLCFGGLRCREATNRVAEHKTCRALPAFAAGEAALPMLSNRFRNREPVARSAVVLLSTSGRLRERRNLRGAVRAGFGAKASCQLGLGGLHGCSLGANSKPGESDKEAY